MMKNNIIRAQLRKQPKRGLLEQKIATITQAIFRANEHQRLENMIQTVQLSKESYRLNHFFERTKPML